MDIVKREVLRQGTVITLEIHSLEASNTPGVTRRVAEAMRGASQIVVDLGALRYFDVTGFAAILKWVASSDGPDVRLCSKSGAIQALFELLGGDTIVPLFLNREEAMESFKTLSNRQNRGVEAFPVFREDPLHGRRAV